VLDGVSVVRPRPLKLLLEKVRRVCIGDSFGLAFGRGGERAPDFLLVLLSMEMAGSALTSCGLLPFGLVLVAFKNGSDYFLR
jgi:hypothetical protein